MMRLDCEIEKFANNYMVVPGHLEDASQRLRTVWHDATSVCITTLLSRLVIFYCLTTSV